MCVRVSANDGEKVWACICFKSILRSSFKHSACPVHAPGRGANAANANED